MADHTTLPSRGLWLRPIGKSSGCFRMTAGVKSGKAQNEHMFSGFPKSGQIADDSVCPLCAIGRLMHRNIISEPNTKGPSRGGLSELPLAFLFTRTQNQGRDRRMRWS